MRFGNQVTDFHIIGESLKAMREPPGNVQLATVFRCKLEALPAAERRRVRSEVDDDVPDLSCDAAHQFHLAVRLALKMHAAQSAPPRRDRDAMLGKACFQTMGRELVDAEGAREKATFIAGGLHLDDPSILERRPPEMHMSGLASPHHIIAHGVGEQSGLRLRVQTKGGSASRARPSWAPRSNSPRKKATEPLHGDALRTCTTASLG